MNPFPDEKSVLIMDNCRIHHTNTLQDVLNAAGWLTVALIPKLTLLIDLEVMLLYLPPYSPDLSPIEPSFSTWKANLRRNGGLIQADNDPIHALLDSLGCITAEMARNWFCDAGYIVRDDV